MQPDTSAARPTRVRWLIFVLACAASWLLYLHRYAWGIIKPYFSQEHPEFSDVDLGWLDSAFLATYAFGQIPGGLAGDRFGPRITLSLFTIAWSCAVGGVAWTSGFWRLIGARGIFGLAQAGVYPVLNKMTRIWFPLATRTSVQGIVTALGRIGGGLRPGHHPLFFDGQARILLADGPGGDQRSRRRAGASRSGRLVRNRPREHAWTNEAEQRLLEDDVPTPPSAETSVQKRPMLQLTQASILSFAMMLLYIFASTFQDQFFVNLLPTFLTDDKHFDKETMGLYLPLVLLGGAAGGIVGGFLNDYLIRRSGNRRWARSLVAFTGKLIAAGLVLVSIQFEDGRHMMLVLIAVRVFSDWSLPTQWATVTDMGGRAAATVFGIVNTVGALGGFVAGPVFGYLKKVDHGNGLLYGVAALCVFAAFTWLFIDCTKRVVGD